MNTPSANKLKKILSVIKKNKKKYLSIDFVAKQVGMYSDVLMDDLSYFDPLIRMDPSKNMRDFEKDIEEYLNSLEERKALEPKPKKEVLQRGELNQYPNIATFVYEKMTTPGGLIDLSIELSDHDLYVLKKLVDVEMKKRKAPAKKKR